MRACRTKGRCHEGSKNLAARSSDRVDRHGNACRRFSSAAARPGGARRVRLVPARRRRRWPIACKSARIHPNPKNAGTDFAIEHSALGDTTFVGFGIGYTWNRWLRFDVTAEYRTKANLHAWGSYTAFCPVGVCLDVLDGFENSWVVLGNAYFDLG